MSGSNRTHRRVFFCVMFVFGLLCLVSAIGLTFDAIWHLSPRQLHVELASSAAVCGVLGIFGTWIGAWGVFFAR